MASIVVTPLNNGITPTGSLVGLLALNSGSSIGYLYYDSIGDIYFQVDSNTPATLLMSAGFAITCTECFFDGAVFNIFMGGVSGNYILGTLDAIGTSTLMVYSFETTDITSVTFNILSWSFTAGTLSGKILNIDLATSLVSENIQLTSPEIPEWATLKVAAIKYELTTNKYLIACVSSTNTNSDSSTNITVLFYGELLTLVSHNVIGKNLWLCTIGFIEDSSGLKKVKLIAAGEDCKIYSSYDGLQWTAVTFVDQQLQINSLTFNSWVFVAGLPYGIILLSANGEVWESAYDAQLSSDVIDVKNS